MSACQFCLADSRYTGLGADPSRRCPVCGAAYSGPRREAEFRALVEAGLVGQRPTTMVPAVTHPEDGACGRCGALLRPRRAGRAWRVESDAGESHTPDRCRAFRAANGQGSR